MAKPLVGDRELSLLRHLDGQGARSVGEVVASFGETHGLARTTVLTMLERLRAKGYLKRRRVEGVYRYRAAVASGDVARNVVGRFVGQTLDGSVSPFVAWMAEYGKVTDIELAELKALVAQLGSERKEK